MIICTSLLALPISHEAPKHLSAPHRIFKFGIDQYSLSWPIALQRPRNGEACGNAAIRPPESPESRGYCIQAVHSPYQYSARSMRLSNAMYRVQQPTLEHSRSRTPKSLLSFTSEVCLPAGNIFRRVTCQFGMSGQPPCIPLLDYLGTRYLPFNCLGLTAPSRTREPSQTGFSYCRLQSDPHLRRCSPLIA